MNKRTLDLLREKTRLSFSVEEKDETFEMLLSTCVLLLELASVDGVFADEERKQILALFRDEYQMFVGDVEELMDVAEDVLAESKNDLEFTNAINQHYSHSEKLNLIRLLWRVVLADKIVDQKEEQLVERIAAALSVSTDDIHKAAREGAR